ncbi:uncharacterized protein F5147DRAFT_586320 [Suillus discolor]|uniref:Uncharacterized protein n=1 Tax=Suillus discolor TaxID=1912936 RepID=A0A9P7EW58_9AGAM|nr:uncharacterized protein F5147DRAFT_586320 [Suillus discolor]KAG2091535.1 hypothetical protein F5147DRAFT_586320 [Suillus discolor]
MLCSYIKATRFRRWLARPDCPPAIQECRVLFDKVYAPKVPEDLYTLIRRRKAVLRASLKFDGIIYSRASTHLGNSQILFYPDGDRSLTPVPASIIYIYGTTTGEMSFAVQRHLPLDIHNDPFSMYPDFPAKLYSTNLQSSLEKVKVSWVVGHFARWAVSDSHAVILSLSRD